MARGRPRKNTSAAPASNGAVTPRRRANRNVSTTLIQPVELFKLASVHM